MAQKLSNLANKSKVKFGSLYGSPIVWIVADKNHAGYPLQQRHARDQPDHQDAVLRRNRTE